MLAILLCASAYSAGAAEAPDSSRMLREVEVLGVKQMPDAEMLPSSHFGRAEISALDITTVKNLGDMVPNLYTPSYGSRMTASIYMRGMGSRIDQPVVGLNIDGVPILNKDSYDTELPFISRIDVLRGARSVLNGRNAMAGQINIYTMSPANTRGTRLFAQYGRNNSLRVDAGEFVGISEKLSTSVTAMYSHTDGFWRNTFDNSRTGRENNASVRWKTFFSPHRSHTITNTMAFSIARQQGYPYASATTGIVAYDDTCAYRRNNFSDGLTVAWSGKRVLVTSLTSVQYLDDCMSLDQDFTTLDYFTLTQSRREFTFTEDLFAKGRRGDYSWLGGVFGFVRRSRMSAPVDFHNAGIERLIEDKRNQMNPAYPIRWDNRSLLLGSRFTSPSSSIALYHQSTYSAGAWTFDAGIRYETEYVGCTYNSDADASYTTFHDGEVFGITPVSIHDRGHMSQTFSQLLPRLTVSLHHDRLSAYASATKGYKSGGFNAQMFSDVLQQRLMSLMGLAMTYSPEEIVRYKPETSWNYEIGLTYDNPVKRINVCLTGFLIRCSNQQLTVFPPGTVTGRVMANAGRTLSQGLELTAKWASLETLAFDAAYGFTDARFRKYDNGRVDFRGKRVPYSPSNTFWARGSWETPWHPAGLRTSIDLHAKGTGKIMWNEENTLSQPFYVLVGGSVSLSSEHWTLRLWGENITSTRYAAFCFTSIGNTFFQRGNPATWGASIALSL